MLVGGLYVERRKIHSLLGDYVEYKDVWAALTPMESELEES